MVVHGKVQFSDTIISNGQSKSFGGRFAVTAGQTFDFAVGPNLPYSGHVGLEATIVG